MSSRYLMSRKVTPGSNKVIALKPEILEKKVDYKDSYAMNYNNVKNGENTTIPRFRKSFIKTKGFKNNRFNVTAIFATQNQSNIYGTLKQIESKYAPKGPINAIINVELNDQQNNGGNNGGKKMVKSYFRPQSQPVYLASTFYDAMSKKTLTGKVINKPAAQVINYFTGPIEYLANHPVYGSMTPRNFFASQNCDSILNSASEWNGKYEQDELDLSQYVKTMNAKVSEGIMSSYVEATKMANAQFEALMSFYNEFTNQNDNHKKNDNTTSIQQLLLERYGWVVGANNVMEKFSSKHIKMNNYHRFVYIDFLSTDLPPLSPYKNFDDSDDCNSGENENENNDADRK